MTCWASPQSLPIRKEFSVESQNGIPGAIEEYVSAVKNGIFPGEEHSFNLDRSMEVITDITSLREFLRPFRLARKSICLVPTMGNLHAGHLSLVEEARVRGEIIVTSLYVNPLQFGPQEDLQSYPRTLDEDKRPWSKSVVTACSLRTQKAL